jgi:uncharacterized protein
VGKLTPDTALKYDRLLTRLKELERVLVAFSGGLDSGFLLHAAANAVGQENLLAVTGDSPSLAGFERECATRFVSRLGLQSRHRIISTDEIKNREYASNTPERCYFCKTTLYGVLGSMAREEGYECIVDGCNASDVSDHRPGRRAARESGVVSPLLEVGLDKDEIRELARSEGLEIWDKPQAACLASRIPYGEEVTEEKLAMVEKAEAFLRQAGIRQARVRHHGRIARIEVEAHDIEKLASFDVRAKVDAKFREIGFTWVTLDLHPFESGNMNVLIKDIVSERRE